MRVLQKPQHRRRPVGQPHIKIPVPIPVNRNHRPRIIVKIKSRHRTGGGKSTVAPPQIQKTHISLMPTEGKPAFHQLIDRENGSTIRPLRVLDFGDPRWIKRR
jgi:hypothetical protein